MKKENVKVYDTAAYIRLSSDDMDIDGVQKTESNSVSNQRELLREFIRSNEDMQLYDIYVDDGFSGKDFKRPEFKRMMTDIYAGKVQCIVCKDLSRFSRDTIEAGEYQKRIFPELGIRFVAIGDHYDSLTASSVERNLMVPVKNMVNESYLADVSAKIRMSQDIKRKNGQFIGSFTVFGYKKDEHNVNALVLDEYAAGIVREIFYSKMDGMSMSVIANKLNDRYVPSPLEYKKMNGEKYTSGFRAGKTTLWSAVAVRRILMNEIYTGTMVQGMNATAGFKSKQRKKNADGSDYVVKVQNTHPAIISKTDFEIVQRLMKFDGRWKDGDPSIFNGILFCADCNTPMIRRTYHNKSGTKRMYVCKTNNQGNGCSRHAIEEEKLKKIVFKALKVYLEGCLDYSKVLEKAREYQVTFDQIQDYDEELNKLHEKYIIVTEDIKGFKEDMESGVITPKQFERYTEDFTKKADSILKQISDSERVINSLLKNGVAAGIDLEVIKQTISIPKLDRRTLVRFVQAIWVYEGEELRLKIEFMFRNEMPKLEAIKKCIKEKDDKAKYEDWEVITSA